MMFVLETNKIVVGECYSQFEKHMQHNMVELLGKIRKVDSVGRLPIRAATAELEKKCLLANNIPGYTGIFVCFSQVCLVARAL